MLHHRLNSLQEQRYRQFQFFDTIYHTDEYIKRLTRLQSIFRSWFSVIVVIEFDINEGHQVFLEYPTGVLTTNEKNQLMPLSFPNTCSTKIRNTVRRKIFKSSSKCGWLTFRFRRDKSLSLVHTSCDQRSFLIGTSFFRTVRDRTYCRGARQESLVVLSSLPIQYFYPVLLPVTIYIGKFYFQYGPCIIYDVCTYIDATWPRVPDWKDPPLILTLTTRITKPLKLCCAAHRDDISAINWDLIQSPHSTAQDHRQGFLQNYQHKRLLPSLTRICSRRKSSPLTPFRILTLWQLIDHLNRHHYTFLLSCHDLFVQNTHTYVSYLANSRNLKRLSNQKIILRYLSRNSLRWERDTIKCFGSEPFKQRISLPSPCIPTNILRKSCFIHDIHYKYFPYLLPLRKNPYTKFDLFPLQWYPCTSLVLALGPLVEYVWELWEIAITESPLLVISKTAMRSCAIVLNILRLLYPLQYAGDYRPYVNAYDHDLSYYQERFIKEKHSTSMFGGVILGGADPSLLQSLCCCSNIMVVDIPSDLCSPFSSMNHSLISRMGSLSKVNVFARKASNQKGDSSNQGSSMKSPINFNKDTSNAFWLHRCSPSSFRKDPALLAKVHALMGSTQELKTYPSYPFGLPFEKYQKYITLDREIFHYFEHLIRHFLCAFQEFVRPDTKQLMINPIGKTPVPVPFVVSKFSTTLTKKKHLLEPLFTALGRHRVLNLYQRFICTKTFRAWHSAELLKERHNTQLLQLKYCAAVNIPAFISKITLSTAEEGCVTLSQLLKDCYLTAPSSDLLAAKQLLKELQHSVAASFSRSLSRITISGIQCKKHGFKEREQLRSSKSYNPEKKFDSKFASKTKNSLSGTSDASAFFSAQEES